MRLVLDEWVATTVQLYFGKSTTESDEKFQTFIQVLLLLYSGTEVLYAWS